MELVEQRLLFRYIAHEVHLVVFLLQIQLMPDVEQEVEGVGAMAGIEAVMELEAVLLETEHVQPLVVKVTKEFRAHASEAALMELTPHGHHGTEVVRLREMVVDDGLQVAVDGIQRHAAQVGHDAGEDSDG